MKGYAIDWKINTYWTAEYDDHGDGTCTLLSWYCDGRYAGRDCDRCFIQELPGRIADVLVICEKGDMSWNRGDVIQELKIRNPQQVFTYGQEPVVKLDE